MEAEYNWPVAHREGMPDLSGGEAAFYAGVQEFNTRSRNIKVVFINQFGFDPQACGYRMPSDMEFMDIRKGSDVEFGQSIYEPFGIAQLEPLTFGGICVLTNVCGCAGFVKTVAGTDTIPNVIFADYTDINGDAGMDIDSMLRIDKDFRDRIERSAKRSHWRSVPDCPKMMQSLTACCRVDMNWPVIWAGRVSSKSMCSRVCIRQSKRNITSSLLRFNASVRWRG
jgi:hypothetical protein